MVIERAAVIEPCVWRETTGVRGRLVVCVMLDGRHAAVGNDDRRVFVARAEHDAERLELAGLLRPDLLARSRHARALPRLSRRRDSAISKWSLQNTIVFDRLRDRPLMHRPAFAPRRTRAATSPPHPASTAPSFQPRSTPSAMPGSCRSRRTAVQMTGVAGRKLAGRDSDRQSAMRAQRSRSRNSTSTGRPIAALHAPDRPPHRKSRRRQAAATCRTPRYPHHPAG